MYICRTILFGPFLLCTLMGFWVFFYCIKPGPKYLYFCKQITIIRDCRKTEREWAKMLVKGTNSGHNMHVTHIQQKYVWITWNSKANTIPKWPTVWYCKIHYSNVYLFILYVPFFSLFFFIRLLVRSLFLFWWSLYFHSYMV